jgi:hypothetical protein
MCRILIGAQGLGISRIRTLDREVQLLRTIWLGGRIASPETLLDTELLPHLICYPPVGGGVILMRLVSMAVLAARQAASRRKT